MSLILSLVGPLPARAADPVGYDPDVAGAYLLPAQAANDSGFVRTNVLTADGLHVDGHFAELMGEQNAVSVSGGNRNVLDPASTYMHSENRKWWTTYQWVDMGETMKELLSTMQITANISASLTADRHMHLGTHKDLTDRAQAYLYAGYNTSPIVKVSNSSDDPDGVARTYTSSGVLTSGGTNLRFRMGATDCACGSSKVSKVYIYLTDTAAPTLTGIYVSDGAGNKVSRTAYKGGETLYLTLEMSEPIRFADGVAHNDLKLNLDLISTSTGQSASSIEAGFYALTGSKLIFSYTVPSGQNMDYTVVSVEPGKQSWMTNSYDLKLLDENGSPMDNGSFTVNSLVTDLAGNPLSWASGRELDSRLYLDDVAPGYTRLNAQGNMTQGYKVGTDGNWPSDITPSATWAGVGDYLAFTLTLNEEVGLWTGDSYAQLTKNSGVTAVLNVKDGDGDSVEVGLSSVSYAMDNVNDVRNSTILTFQSFRPGDGMTLEGDAISIVSLKAPDDSALGDMAGNPLATAVSKDLVVEKLGLDVTPPEVTILDGQVTVNPVETSGNGRYVTIPFTVTDETGGSGVALGQEVALGIDIATAFTVRYCITNNAAAPDKDNSAYRLLSYQQPTYPLPASTNDTYYLHICCSNLSWDTDPATGKMPLSVSITCQDYAGNTASDTVDYDIPFDQTGPEISLPTTFTVSGKGEISVPFSVSDSTHLASVTVQWNEAQASELLDSGNASASFSGTATYSVTSDSGTATLTVTARDKAGNSNTKTQEYIYNLTTVNRYALGGDPAVATGDPSLTLSAPGNQGGGGAEGNELVTVAVLGDGAGSYNLYTVAGRGSGKNIFNNATPDAIVSGITVTEKSVTLSGYAADGSGWTTSSAYGNLPVTIFTLLKSDWEAAVTNATDGTVSITSESTVDQFSMLVLTQSSYTVTFGTPQDSDGTEVPAALVEKGGGMVQTLTGLRVPITLTTGKDVAYALQDINYDASYVVLLDGSDREVPGSKQFFQKPEAGTTIVYPISVPLYDTWGTYGVEVHLTYLDGTTSTVTGSEILYMYDLTSDDFYPTELKQTYQVNSSSPDNVARTVGMDESTTQVSLGFTGSDQVTLSFTSFDVPLVKTNTWNQGKAPIEIWNESLGENAVHVTNYPALSNYTPLTLRMYSEGAPSATALYLVEGENIVRYRALLPNGNYTAAKTLIITVHNADPTFAVAFTSNGAGGLRMQLTDLSGDAEEALALNGRTLLLADSVGALDTASAITITLDSSFGLDLTRAELAENWQDNPVLQLMDEYGNFTTVTVHPRYDIDILPPRVTLYQGSNVTVSKGTFCLTAVVSDYDNSNDCSEGLDLSSFALTFEYSDGTTVTTPLPDIIPNGTWTGSGAGYAGIYKVEDTTTYNDTEDGKTRGVDLLIYGQYPYGTTSDTVRITLSCQDNLGNACVDKNQYNHAYCTISNIAYTATEPTVTASGGEGQVTLTSDLPIRVLDPMPTADTAGTFAAAHTLPIYTDSADITYEDVFGNQYTETISASPFGDLSVTLSETAATRGPVTLTATATGEAAITAVTSENNGSGAISGSTATLELTANDTVTITMGEETYTVEVTNIDNAVEPVTVAFYGPDGQLLNAGSGAESVTGPVTAALQCSELLVGETSHVFPIGSPLGESYAFAVADQVGNTKTVTATLPWAVVNETGETTPPTDDTTPPEYTVSLYIQRSGGWTQVNSYDSQIQPPTSTGAEDLSPAGLATDLPNQLGQAVRLASSIRDDSPVKLIVKNSTDGTPAYTDDSDPIDGLSVSASTLTWEGEAETTVYVYLVDASGNAAAALELTFPAVDKTPPTATVAYEVNGENVWAYLVPNEADKNDFIVLDTNLLKKDETSGAHQGQYYYEFQANGTYIFRFSDGAGNIGTATATVHSIDNTPLDAPNDGIQWLSRGQTYSNTDWTTAQSDLHTNAAVTAVINTNIALDSVTLPQGTTGVTAAVTANQARITFSANTTGALTLTLKARNGKTATVTLPAVTCIDTTAPTVTVSGDGVTKNSDGTYTVSGTDKRSVELTFTTNEDTAADRDSSFGTSHTYTASKNGEVSLTFTDRAGNVTQVTLDIQDLDDKLALSYSKNADGAGAVTDPADLKLQTGQTFYVKSTRNVTVTLGTASSVSVTKGEWTQFTLPEDPGLVVLKAVDDDGNTLYAYLTVALPDTVPPVISLPSQIFYAQAGAENLDLLQDGVTVTDNGEGSVTTSVNAENVTWDTSGSYTVTYTAMDASGNSSTVTRTLVLTREAPIGLTVNGQTVYQGSTLTLSKGTASLTLQGVDTPVYLALKQGYKTVAQMKLNAQVLLNGSYTGALSASLNTTGFYTLYLRTQDRTEYVFYLYVKG
ncbi:hypothetical protein B5F88_12900 [Flavonifractor sp. An306]|nr:hypothetical protein B5F88_12900 [Flavonifractor sp. An306]